ncbi:hypothetical protein OSTOST_13005 [Ostertagia ostertagi]
MAVAICSIEQFRDSATVFDMGEMNCVCSSCGAFRWKAEKASICCHGGKVTGDVVSHVSPHAALQPLFSGATNDSKEFLANIRKYNQAFAFTSMSSNLDLNLASDRDGIYTFRVNGELYHRIGDGLEAEDGDAAKFSQIYFLDSEAQSPRRLQIFSDLRPMAVATIHDTMQAHNALVQQFVAAREMAQNTTNVVLSINGSAVPAGEHPRRYNAASASEVAAVWLNEESTTNRDIVLRKRGGGLKRINECHPMYDALSYPLFFPEGTQGWSVQLKTTSKVTLKAYVQFRMQCRSSPNVLHMGGKLFQQYIVDQYLRVEAQNLLFIRLNQTQLRAECYQGIVDALDNGDTHTIGRRIVLPATTIGSPRYMQQRFQDSMALVRKFGKPDLFITMTCNPKWPEITRLLFPHQKPQDRPDIVVRVFHLKFQKMLDDIVKKSVFGKVQAHCYTVEFQKRGLPHTHLLVWLESKPTEEQYDSMVCAEIPDPESQPRLYASVKSHMVHGPCGRDNPHNVCMVDGACTKKFPKAIAESTVVGDNGLITYRRRGGGPRVQKRVRNTVVELGNEWIVPYNPFLIGKYDCHINVEICNSVSSVKYLHKYIYKGQDRAVLEAGEDIDEISQYLEGRYISAQEACWRLLSFETNSISHNIIRLPVHLPGQQYVTFNASAPEAAVENNERTMLTEFFETNRVLQQQAGEGDAPELLTYCEFPERYRWNSGPKTWTRRRREWKVVARMTMAPPGSDRFHLRLLLSHVRGPTSYEDLRTHNGVLYETFQEAAIARGLLEDDTEYDTCLEEAALSSMPSQIRRLFATMVAFSEPADVARLFRNHYDAMAEDQRDMPEGQRQFRVIADLDRLLEPFNMRMSTWINLDEFYSEGFDPNDDGAQDEFSHTERETDFAQLIDTLNVDQRAVFERVAAAVRLGATSEERVFFLDGPGGTGKTYVYNVLLRSLRSEGFQCMAMASSGIAACLLQDGRTAHSTLAIPLELNETSTCHFGPRSAIANTLRNVDLMIWDEAPMASRYAIEAVDRTMRDALGVDKPFGGKVMLFGGDFRQILPVVLQGGRSATVGRCLKKSPLWRHVVTMTLTINMRLQSRPDFQQFLLDVGEGRTGVRVNIEESMVATGNNLDGLIDDIFADGADFEDRVILAVKNDDAQMINRRVVARLPGDFRECLSADYVDEEDGCTYPVEFLNTLQLSGLPPHKLELKPGQFVMLLRNLNPSRGLSNGTRLRLLEVVSHRLLRCQIIEGRFADDVVLIPRITHHCSDSRMPFTLYRRQFPVTGAFAMTINKSQGQSFNHVGVYLGTQVFTHGQLYVALSRGRHPDQIKVVTGSACAADGVHNVVFSEII